MTHHELLSPPPIESANDPIHSPADMRQRWRALMGPLGFGAPLLWLGFVGPDRAMIKVFSQVPIGPRPRRGLIESVMVGLLRVLDDMPAGTTVAMLLTRPGTGAISGRDRRWCAALTAAAEEFGVSIEPIFRAHDESLVLVEPSETSP